MASLNAKYRACFAEWLENIAENDLQLFVFTNSTSSEGFGSNDFNLVYAGLSKAEPMDCHMVEARVNGATKDKQLKRLFQNSRSAASDPTRLALVLIPQSMADYCKGQHVRQALQESPIEGALRVNKVHVQWAPAMKLRDGKPRFEAGVMPFVFEKIPFAGYNVDGTLIKKRDKENKK